LRNHQLFDVHFRRQYSIDPYIVDFCAPSIRLVIEVDGGQHASQTEDDDARTKYLEDKGFHVLRFWTVDIFTRIDSAKQVICEYIENHVDKGEN
jgi:very-short-patch-repair endonuclease